MSDSIVFVAARERRGRGAARTRRRHGGANRVAAPLAHAYAAICWGGCPDRRAHTRHGRVLDAVAELERRAGRRRAGRNGRAAREKDVDLRIGEPRRAMRPRFGPGRRDRRGQNAHVRVLVGLGGWNMTTREICWERDRLVVAEGRGGGAEGRELRGAHGGAAARNTHQR